MSSQKLKSIYNLFDFFKFLIGKCNYTYLPSSLCMPNVILSYISIQGALRMYKRKWDSLPVSFEEPPSFDG